MVCATFVRTSRCVPMFFSRNVLFLIYNVAPLIHEKSSAFLTSVRSVLPYKKHSLLETLSSKSCLNCP